MEEERRDPNRTAPEDFIIDVEMEGDSADPAWLAGAMMAACVRQVSLTGAAIFGSASGSGSGSSAGRVTVRRTRRFLELTPTALRRSPAYYYYYCVLANTLAASALPLAALIFLNISTVRVLRWVAVLPSGILSNQKWQIRCIFKGFLLPFTFLRLGMLSPEIWHVAFQKSWQH